MTRIYLSVPHMGENEQRYVGEAFATNWLSSVGPNVDAFERSFGQRVQELPCLAVSSGTAALHLALRLLGVDRDDDVICPTLTFVATANAATYLGARPVFVDSDETSWNLDPGLLDEVLRERARRGRLPRAVVVVHLYGQSADLDPIMETCARYDVPIVEDAAEALGTTYKGRPVGTFAPLSVFSFNGNKIITTTSGGMLVARDPAHVAKARFWSTQARDPGIAYEHSEYGFNYRMSNVLAGIGRGQLEVLDDRVARRRAIAFRYRDAFADLPGLSLMPQASFGFHTNWLSAFLVDQEALGCSRDEIIANLRVADIEARPVWKPMHLQPLFRTAEVHRGAVAERLFRDGICLPSSSSLTSSEQEEIIDIIRRTARQQPSQRKGTS